MSFSDVEHFAEIISGCEAINSGNRTAPEARYAFAVLKLHAQDNSDFSSIVGQEGFIESVKKGAQKTGEWVVKLIKAIRDWLTGAWKKTVRWVKFEGNSEIIVKMKTKMHASLKNIEVEMEQSHTAEVVRDLSDKGVKLQVNDTVEMSKAINNELDKSGKLDEGKVLRNLDKVMDNMKSDIEKLNVFALKHVDDKDGDMSILGERAANLSKRQSSLLNGLIVAQEKINSNIAANKDSSEDKKD